MNIKTSEATPLQLDWLVAKCRGHTVFIKHAPVQVMYTPERKRSWYTYRPSTNWAQGGPIIDREKISTLRYGQWLASIPADSTGESSGFYGPTPLIAAMRCYVASKLGDEIEIPEELT